MMGKLNVQQALLKAIEDELYEYNKCLNWDNEELSEEAEKRLFEVYHILCD